MLGVRGIHSASVGVEVEDMVLRVICVLRLMDKKYNQFIGYFGLIVGGGRRKCCICRIRCKMRFRRLFMKAATIIIQFRLHFLKMKVTTNLLLIALLLVALNSQAATLSNVASNADNQHALESGEPRSDSSAKAGSQNKVYTPPATGPEPVTITCPFNQVYDNILCQCVCIIGYHFVGSECVQNGKPSAICGKNQVYQDNRCVCAIGYNLIEEACDVCPPYSSYDLATLSCPCIPGYYLKGRSCEKQQIPEPPTPNPPVITCSLNERLVDGNCICVDGFFPVKGVCTYCAKPNYYDAEQAICRPRCTKNQVLDLDSLTCICISGFYDIDGNCGGCQAYAVYNAKKRTCDCVRGYKLNNGNCIPDTHVPLPPTPLPIPPSQCEPNEVFVYQTCICKKDYNRIDGICQTCPDDTYFDVGLQICRVPCPANEIYDIINNTCGCAAETYRINGTCTKCPGNTTYSAVTGVCGCAPGYRNQGGFCVVGCGPNQILSNGQCCCITGFYPVNGICSQCNWNQVYDEGLGICRIPCNAKRIYNIQTQRCECLPKFYELADGTCASCTLYSTFDPVTKTCVCDKGYILNLGLCTSACNPYEQFVNGVCVCKKGYYLIGYSCGVCPPLLTYDATYRICRNACKTNEVWDPTIRACRCLPGYYLVGGICSQCNPKTQVYNQRAQCCDCIEGFQKVSGQGCNGVCSPICSSNQDWIGGRCVCKPGYFLINNFCTQCPKGQIYDVYQRLCRVQCGSNQVYNFNSGKCDCAQGYYIVQGACSRCLAGQTYNEYTQTCSIVPCQGLNEYFSKTTQQCVCEPQYVRIRGVCTNCPPGYYYDSYSDQCLCKPGYKQAGGICKSVCEKDQTYINGKCVCNNGEKLVNGKCISINVCPLYSHYDYSSGCCVCNSGYSVINGECSSYQYCGLNGYLRYGKCYCKEGFFWILGSCQPCGANQAYNGVVCECLVGFIRNVNGVCVKSNFIPNCYKNERYDTTLQACVCKDDAKYLKGECQKIPSCPQNAEFNGASCACSSGFLLKNGRCVQVDITIPDCPKNAFFNSVSCTCNTGYYQSSLSSCAPCAKGTAWDGTKCSTAECANGYIFNDVSSQCEPEGASCGQNSYWNGAVCVCASGFHQIDGKCQRCGAGTNYDGSKCVSSALCNPPVKCGSNQIYVNGACTCSAGFNKINGACIACPENTKWNGAYCACTDSDSSKWCFGAPYSSFSNGSCSCQSGYVSVNGICTASS